MDVCSDSLGNHGIVIAESFPSTYDPAAIKTLTDPAGKVIDFTHDDLYRRTATAYPGGSP